MNGRTRLAAEPITRVTGQPATGATEQPLIDREEREDRNRTRRKRRRKKEPSYRATSDRSSSPLVNKKVRKTFMGMEREEIHTSKRR